MAIERKNEFENGESFYKSASYGRLAKIANARFV